MGMSSKSMLTILELCEALEFKKHPDPNSGDLFMTLRDAVLVTWSMPEDSTPRIDDWDSKDPSGSVVCAT